MRFMHGTFELLPDPTKKNPYKQHVQIKFYCLILLSFLVVGSSDAAAKEANKCAVFDAFKVLPENSTNYVGGSFALHGSDCRHLIAESVQEIVALQWVFAHWNNAQKVSSSQIGLYVGDSCSRPKESLLQTLRFLDFINFYEPKECTKKARNGSMIGVLAPKDRSSAKALAGVLQSTNLLVGAYTSESVEALLEGGVQRVLTTVPLLDDYISAFSALMTALESDLVIVVSCDETSPRLNTILQLLGKQEIHVSEVIHVAHPLIAEVLKNTESNMLLYIPCEQKSGTMDTREISSGPQLLVTLGLNARDIHFPFRIEDSQEIIIRQSHTDLPLFKPYFLRILAKNYDTYELASSYIQLLINCTFANRTCPPISVETLSSVYAQGENVDGIVRLAYAFAVAARFVDLDENLKLACAKTTGTECVDRIFAQLSTMRFVHEKRGPLELANEELGFFPKSDILLQSIGLRLEAVLGGGQEEIFKYLIAREPKLISKAGMPSAIRSIRSVCLPYHSFCGQCEQTIPADSKTTFLNNQQVNAFYIAALFENIGQGSVISSLAFTHTLNTIAEKHPNLVVKPMKDYGAILFDSLESRRAREFTISTETQCLKLPLTEYNVSIPPQTILGYVSALSDQDDEHISLLRGFRIPTVRLASAPESKHAGGVLELLPSVERTARALAEYLKSMGWEFVSVVVSSLDPKSMSIFEAFSQLVSRYEICVGNVLFYSPLNRTRLNNHQSSTNVTLFFTTSRDAAEFVGSRLRFNVELANNVDVMVGEAGDFYLHEPTNMIQYAGSVSIRPKDMVPVEFKEYLKTLTPILLPETWFWTYVEQKWRCALLLENRIKYEGRLCTGNEHLNPLEFGQLAETGILIRGVERLVLAIDEAYRRACPLGNRGFCDEFLVNGRKLIREALDSKPFEVEFQVDEFVPIDHHGNLGYRQIGNFSSVDLKYQQVEEYRIYASGIPKYENEHKSVCDSPLCICRQSAQSMGDSLKDSPLRGSDGKYGSIMWFHADKTTLFLEWDDSTVNYVVLGITSTILCLSVLTLLLVLYKIYMRVIKGNQSLGIFSLFGIVLLNLTAYLYIFDSTDQLHELRSLLNGFSHTICFALILIKALRLRNSEDICKQKLQIGWNYWMMLFFISAVQLSIYMHRLDTAHLRESFTQGYIGFLLILALVINVRNGGIRRNYKESKWLLLTNLVSLTLYAAWLTSRTLLTTNYTRHIDVTELNLMSLVLLLFLFGPKLWILFMYQPIIVERCETPMKPPALEDDLFGANSPDISTRSNLSRKGSLTRGSSSTITSPDEYPVLKTIMRKRDFAPVEKKLRNSQSSEDRHSSASTTSS